MGRLIIGGKAHSQYDQKKLIYQALKNRKAKTVSGTLVAELS